MFLTKCGRWISPFFKMIEHTSFCPTVDMSVCIILQRVLCAVSGAAFWRRNNLTVAMNGALDLTRRRMKTNHTLRTTVSRSIPTEGETCSQFHSPLTIAPL